MRNSDQNIASIDVATNEISPLTIEYKWLTSGIVSKDDFIREFIKRDLFNATDLSRIQWRIKGNKLSKEKVLEYLSSKEGREMLKDEKIRKLFEDFGRLNNSKIRIRNVEDLLDFLELNNEWYNIIFK